MKFIIYIYIYIFYVKCLQKKYVICVMCENGSGITTISFVV